ncbi:Pentatricopeptide repeat-containing protein family [Quillaja saponaria]|uniref:Pentatricopeptide repeat-containing protein family n=1 Tax=Quillaja saponaria TaxID=32244 RepID=A0AAD7QBH7_QUISA|nr:Pentatricopeptide repeat-containing protein family [Quillaja saponaria]
MELTTMSQVMQLHAQILKLGTQNKQTQQRLSKLFTFSALSPSGDLTYACLILNSMPNPNSYYYNTMLRAYSQSSDSSSPIHALSLFLSMVQEPTDNSPRPDKFTYPFVLKSCARLKLTHQGKQLHGSIVKLGFGLDRYILNTLIHVYSECGETGLAYSVFERMSDRDVVSWTSMIDGFGGNDRPIEAIKLFEQMVETGIEVNDASVVSVLRACADIGALSMGRRVHRIVEERKIGYKANVKTALVDMYAKSGCIESARRVFDDAVDKDVFIWTAMISGLASHGQCREAIELFVQMEKSDVKPDERTMTTVLSACRNAGLVREGFMYLHNMQKQYGVRVTIQHYGCMVDLLARSQRLKEAEEFIHKMPIKPDAVLWRTLIWACKIHGDTDRAERLMEHLKVLEKDAHDSGTYILAGNVYASSGKWCDKAKVRELMHQKGLLKPPGSSKIEVDGVIHEFVMGDSTHPEAEKIYVKLEEMQEKLTKEGYNPKVSEVMLEIEYEEKTYQLLHHSEKLALAFGLIKTSPGCKIRIVKNLRSCEDCHEFMKRISSVYQREIIVRDRIRFHHFKHGDCSCKDYW